MVRAAAVKRTLTFPLFPCSFVVLLQLMSSSFNYSLANFLISVLNIIFRALEYTSISKV